MKLLEEKETRAIGLECRTEDGESWFSLYPMESAEAAWAQYDYLTTAGPENEEPCTPDEIRVVLWVTTHSTYALERP